MHIINPKSTSSVTIRQEMDRVLLLDQHGKVVFLAPWNAAREIAKQILFCSQRAEEFAKANSIAMDQAILMRAGWSKWLGLTSNPDIKNAAGKEAAWNRDLRRYMPGGIKTHEQVGKPGVIQHDPKENKDG